MTASLWGGTKYESPTSRALGSITVSSYEKVYDDQAQFMSKLAGDVSFLAANDKKQQAGIDQANENFIQQFQDMFKDIIVLLGGGGDTGLDFGDLRYVFIALGALFGFTDSDGHIKIPPNFFEAAWHLFSNYILPVDNFKDAINEIIDEAIATILGLFGDVPIVGQALEQFAEIVSDLRDLLMPLLDAIQAFLSIFSIDLGTIGDDTDMITNITSYFGPLKPIWDALVTALEGIELPDFAAILHKILLWGIPFVDDVFNTVTALKGWLTETVTMAGGEIKNIVDAAFDIIQTIAPILDLVGEIFPPLAPYVDDLENLVTNLNPIVDAIVDVTTNLDPIINKIFGVVGMFADIIPDPPDGWDPADAATNFFTHWASYFVGTWLASNIPGLDASKIISGTFTASLLQPLINAVSQGFGGSTGLSFSGLQSFLAAIPGIQALIDALYNFLTGGSSTGHTISQLITAFGSFPSTAISGVLSSLNIPNLDASKIISGLFGQARIPSLSSSGGYTGAVDGGVLSGGLNTSTTIGGNPLSTLFTSGKFNPGQIGTGAIASGVTLASSALTGLATGIGTWLTSGGALPSAATAAISQITGLATGIGTWLGSGGALPSATTAVASQIISGIFGTGLIPSLDASKVTTGQFAQTFVSGLVRDLIGGSIRGSNLIISPDFEDNTVARCPVASGGTATTVAYSTAQKHGGTQSLLCTQNGTGVNDGVYLLPVSTSTGGSGTLIRTQPGQKFYFECWVLGSASNNGGGTFYLYGLLQDSNGVNPLTSTVAATIPGTTLKSAVWTKVSGYGTVPAGYDLIGPAVVLQTGSVAGDLFYLDDVLVREETTVQGVVANLWGAIGTIGSTILAAVVPGLDSSKIITGLLGQARIPSLSSGGGYSGAIDGGVLSGAINLATTIGGTALSTLFSSGKFNPAQIASGALASGVTLASSALTGLATGIGTWLGAGGALPSATTLATTGLTGLATGIQTWLTSGGALPSATTLAGSALTGLATGIGSWLTGGGALPSATTLAGSGITGALNTAVTIVGNAVSSMFNGTGLVSSFLNSLDASKITTGTFANSFVPGVLPQSIWQATRVGAKNLVYNSDYEDTTAAFDSAISAGGSIAYSTTFAHTGTHSAKLITSNLTSGSHSDAVSLKSNNGLGMWASSIASSIKGQPGQWFYTEIYMRAATTNTTTGGQIMVAAFVEDTTGVNSNTLAALTNAVATNGVSTSGWTKLSGWYQIPAGYDLIAPFVWFSGQSVANQTYYWDDARIAEETWAQATIQQLFGGTVIGAALNTALTISGNALSALFNSTGLLSSKLSGILASGLIPSLDASKITTGTFITSLIPNLAASIINSGTFNEARIPNLDGSWGNTIVGSVLTGALNTALTIAGNALSSMFNATGLVASFLNSLDASKITTGTFSTAFAPWAAPIDTLVQAWGGSGSGYLTSDLTTFAQSISTGFVQGVLGGSNVGNTIENHVDAIVQAVQNNSSTGNSLAVLQGALSGLRSFLGYVTSGSPAANSVAGQAQTSTNFIAQAPAARPTKSGIDPTTVGPYDVQMLLGQTTIPITTVTQSSTLIDFVPTELGGTIESVRWMGYPTGSSFTNIQGFYINLYKINTSTGVSTQVYSSPNIVSSVASGSSPVWNSFNIPSGNWFAASQTDIYVAEIAILGTGSYNVAGFTASQNQIPQLTTNVPASFGAKRTISQLYGAKGFVAGGSGGNAPSITHTMTATDNAVIVTAHIYTAATTLTAGNCTATCGGVAMTQKSFTTVQQNGSQNEYLAVFSLINTAGAPFGAGNKTITVTTPTNASEFMQVFSVSYPGVTAVGTPQTAIGNSTTASITATGMTDQIILVPIASWATSNVTTWATAGGEQIDNRGYVAAVEFPFEIGDIFGLSSSVAISNPVGSGPWGIAAIPITTTAGIKPTTLVNPTSGGDTAYTAASPWIGLSGSAGQTQYPPQIVPIYSSQSMVNPTITYPWANNFDIIVGGDGGGGKAGGSGAAHGGLGGTAGAWATPVTLTRIQMGSSNLTWTIGGGGAGGSSPNANGGNGSGSSCVIPGYGTIGGGALAGAGQSGLNSGPAGISGAGMSGLTYNGTYYPGGGGGSGPSGWGGQPGGGGAGGTSAVGGSNNGGNGGPGIGYIKCSM